MIVYTNSKNLIYTIANNVKYCTIRNVFIRQTFFTRNFSRTIVLRVSTYEYRAIGRQCTWHHSFGNNSQWPWPREDQWYKNFVLDCYCNTTRVSTGRPVSDNRGVDNDKHIGRARRVDDFRTTRLGLTFVEVHLRVTGIRRVVAAVGIVVVRHRHSAQRGRQRRENEISAGTGRRTFARRTCVGSRTFYRYPSVAAATVDNRDP